MRKQYAKQKKAMGQTKPIVSYAMMFPYLFLFSIFTVLPVLLSVFLSFTHFNILEAPTLIGLKNYVKLLTEDDIFLLAIKNTLLLAIVTGPVSYLLSLLVAYLINELTPRLRALVTLVFYAPSISGNVYLIWTMLFSGDSYGFVNGLLKNWGIITTPIQFFTDTDYMMPMVMIVTLWMSLGNSFLSFIAGLQGIDRQYYEAGAIDGIRNRWQELWFITLPLMKPQLLFGAVMNITASFGVGSVVTGLVGFPSNEYAVHTIMHHLEDYGSIRFEMGYASAIATVLFMMMFASNILIKRVLRRVGT